MFAIVVLNFLRQILAYLKGEITTTEPMEEYIEMVEKLGNPTNCFGVKRTVRSILPKRQEKSR